MRGGDASEGDRQDEPENGGNHAHRPAVTPLPLAPLILLVTQPPGRTFARLVRWRMLARCRSRPSPYELTRVGSGTFYQKQRWALYWQNSRAPHTLTQVRLGMHVWPPLPSGNARGFLKGCHPLSSPRPETRASCRGSQGNLLRAFSCPSGAPPVKNHSKQSFRKVSAFRNRRQYQVDNYLPYRKIIVVENNSPNQHICLTMKSITATLDM